MYADSIAGIRPFSGEVLIKLDEDKAPLTKQQMLIAQDYWLELGVDDAELFSIPAGKFIKLRWSNVPSIDPYLRGYFIAYTISFTPQVADLRIFRDSYCAACKIAELEQETVWGDGYCYVRYKGQNSVSYTRGAHSLEDVRQVFLTAAGFNITAKDLQSAV